MPPPPSWPARSEVTAPAGEHPGLPGNVWLLCGAARRLCQFRVPGLPPHTHRTHPHLPAHLHPIQRGKPFQSTPRHAVVRGEPWQSTPRHAGVRGNHTHGFNGILRITITTPPIPHTCAADAVCDRPGDPQVRVPGRCLCPQAGERGSTALRPCQAEQGQPVLPRGRPCVLCLPPHAPYLPGEGAQAAQTGLANCLCTQWLAHHTLAQRQQPQPLCSVACRSRRHYHYYWLIFIQFY